MRMTSLLTAAVVAASAGAASAKKREARHLEKQTSVALRGPHVVYVTGKTAYLGLGSDEGLQVGMTIALRRNGRPVASCKVAEVAAHSATCAVEAGVRPGDAFKAPPVPSRAAPIKTLPSGPTAAQTAQVRTAMDQAPAQVVGFSETQGALSQLAARHLRAEVALSEALYAVDTQAENAFAIQTVTATARDTDLGGGFHTSIDVTALSYLRRPPSYRFPEAASTQLFVRQLELSFRSPTFPLTFAVGRIWPWQTPSIGVLDGAQLGWHARDDSLSTGLIGGTLPDPVTTDPRWNHAHPLVAAYLGGIQSAKGSSTWFQGDAVVSGRFIPDAPGGAGWHYALDGRAIWEQGRWFDAAGEVRAGAGVLQSPGGIELATLDLNLQPVEQLRIAGSARYINDALEQVGQPGTFVDGSLGFVDAQFSSSASASYDLPVLGFTVSGDFNRDTLSGLWRALAEGQLRFPRLMGRAGGVDLGFDESFGWMVGRDAFVELDFFSGRPVELVVRGGYFYDFTKSINTTPAENGISGLVQARLRIARWLSAQASVYSQVALTPSTEGQPFPVGVNVAATLAARF